ncbi:MAG: hypothetical protein CVT60_02960 [Actinobacteria bacterium HGW-Actinobacteria-10]|nr:MAG: hypothetical protein CVT60_02960 [Actinobacteria bacterium HGW-Actinobacteria-10]
MASKRSTPMQMALSVIIVCALAAGSLAATYGVTKDRILAQEKAAEERALNAVLADAESFEPIDEAALESAREIAGDVPVSAAWRALDSSGEISGWGIRIGPRGYSGPIQMIVGLDREGSVTGVMIITINDTPGLGTRVRDEPGHLEQYQGLDANQMESEIKNVDAITGATKSSRGVRHGVEAAAAVYAEVLAVAGAAQ